MLAFAKTESIINGNIFSKSLQTEYASHLTES